MWITGLATLSSGDRIQGGMTDIALYMVVAGILILKTFPAPVPYVLKDLTQDDLDGFLIKKSRGNKNKQAIIGKIRELFYYTSEQALQNAMAGRLDLDAQEELCIEQIADCFGELS